MRDCMLYCPRDVILKVLFIVLRTYPLYCYMIIDFSHDRRECPVKGADFSHAEISQPTGASKTLLSYVTETYKDKYWYLFRFITCFQNFPVPCSPPNSCLRDHGGILQPMIIQLLFPQEHKLQMAEALDNLQAVQEAHKKELSEMQDAANQQSKPLPLIRNLYGQPVLLHTSSDNFAIPCQSAPFHVSQHHSMSVSTIPCQSTSGVLRHGSMILPKRRDYGNVL